MQKGIVVFIFANYLDNVLVWNYAMSGFNSLSAKYVLMGEKLVASYSIST